MTQARKGYSPLLRKFRHVWASNGEGRTVTVTLPVEGLPSGSYMLLARFTDGAEPIKATVSIVNTAARNGRKRGQR